MNYVHAPVLSDYPIACKTFDYRKRLSDWPGGIRYNRDMASPAFDKALVRETMKKQKVSQVALAEVLGIPQSGMSDLLGGRRQVKVQEADTIYRFLGLSFTDGAGVVSVPVIGQAAAGHWREAIEDPIARLVMPKGIAGAKAFGIQIAGDSMDVLIEDGGWVVVDPDDRELVNEKVYLLRNEDFEVTVKQYRTNPPRFEPVSSNPDHKAFLISEHDVLVVGRVVWKGGRM